MFHKVLSELTLELKLGLFRWKQLLLEERRFKSYLSLVVFRIHCLERQKSFAESRLKSWQHAVSGRCLCTILAVFHIFVEFQEEFLLFFLCLPSVFQSHLQSKITIRDKRNFSSLSLSLTAPSWILHTCFIGHHVDWVYFASWAFDL